MSEKYHCITGALNELETRSRSMRVMISDLIMNSQFSLKDFELASKKLHEFEKEMVNLKIIENTRLNAFIAFEEE